MKSFIFSLFLSPFYLFSLFIHNPAAPSLLQEGVFIPDTSCINIRVGSGFYMLSDAVWKFKRASRLEGFSSLRTEGQGFLVNGSCNIKERADIYFSGSTFYLEPKFCDSNSLFDLKTENNGLWQAGIRLDFLQVKDTLFAIDGRGFFWSADTDLLLLNKQKAAKGDSKSYLRGWQLAISFSQRMDLFSPYLGAVFHNNQFKIKDFPYSNKKYLRLKQKRRTGIFLGSSITRHSFLFLDISFRLINQRSLTVMGSIRF